MILLELMEAVGGVALDTTHVAHAQPGDHGESLVFGSIGNGAWNA